MQICDKDNVFPEEHIDPISLWEPIKNPAPGLGNIKQVLNNFEQVFDQPAPGVEIPFLQHDSENITERSLIASAQDNRPESSVQVNHKARVAQIWPNGPVGGLPLARRG